MYFLLSVFEIYDLRFLELEKVNCCYSIHLPKHFLLYKRAPIYSVLMQKIEFMTHVGLGSSIRAPSTMLYRRV